MNDKKDMIINLLRYNKSEVLHRVRFVVADHGVKRRDEKKNKWQPYYPSIDAQNERKKGTEGGKGKGLQSMSTVHEKGG